MAKQLIVSVNGREKKIAIIEDDKVAEFYIERGEQHQGIVGNIYKGRVMRVLPGMQSAFVDIGLERDAFLYVSDFFDEEEEFERIVIDKSKKGAPDAEHAAARGSSSQSSRTRTTHRGDTGTSRAIAGTGDCGRRRSFGVAGNRTPSRSPWPSRPRALGEGRRDAFYTAGTGPLRDTRHAFVAGDPSIERIVDEEETAANGEMFKGRPASGTYLRSDSRRRVQPGRRLPQRGGRFVAFIGTSVASFERIDDGEADAEPIREAGRPREATFRVSSTTSKPTT